MKLTDSNISATIEKIKNEIDSIKQNEKKFIPNTNMNLELFGARYNLHVASLSLLEFLLEFLNSFKDGIMISGYSVRGWKEDIKNKIDSLSSRERLEVLSTGLNSLEDLYSQDIKNQKQFDSILNLLK